MTIHPADNALNEHQGDVLVGTFDPTRRGQKAGSYFAPIAEEARLQTAAGSFKWQSRCNEVAAKAFGKSWIPSGNKESIVCALHPKTEFYTTRPASPVTFYTYDNDKAHYIPITHKTIESRDEELWTLKEVHKQAYEELKNALAKNLTAKEPYVRYAVAHSNLEAALNYRTHLIKTDPKMRTEFFEETQDYADEYSPNALFEELAPHTAAISGETSRAKANRCQSHYEAMQEFFETVGYYAPASVKEKLLGEAVIHLHDALEEAPSEKAAFQKQTGNFLTFASLLRKYTRPKSDAEFRKALVEFLFDRKEATPSEALRRSVMKNPAQRAKLEEMISLKQEAISKAHSFRTLPKRAFRGMIIGGYQLGKALHSLLSDRRMIGITEIVQRALGEGDGWIPNLPYEDFLPDDDAELEEFTKLTGNTPREAKARSLALEQLSYRVHAHAKQAFEKICHSDLTLNACLHHGKTQAFDTASGYLDAVKPSLEVDVYGRLARLGQMAQAHPNPGKTRALGKEPDTLIHKNFKETQKLFTKEVFPALINIKNALEHMSSETVNDRFVTLPDDIENLKSFIPMQSTAVPGRGSIQSHYPDLKTEDLMKDLDRIATQVGEKITNHRTTHLIVNLAEAVAAQRTAQGLAPTTQELKDLANELQQVPHHDTDTELAQTVLDQATILSQEVIEEAANIKKMDPAKRAPSMRALFDALIEVRNSMIRNPINDDLTLEAAQTAIAAATQALVALQAARS